MPQSTRRRSRWLYPAAITLIIGGGIGGTVLYRSLSPPDTASAASQEDIKQKLIGNHDLPVTQRRSTISASKDRPEHDTVTYADGILVIQPQLELVKQETIWPDWLLKLLNYKAEPSFEITGFNANLKLCKEMNVAFAGSTIPVDKISIMFDRYGNVRNATLTCISEYKGYPPEDYKGEIRDYSMFIQKNILERLPEKPARNFIAMKEIYAGAANVPKAVATSGYIKNPFATNRSFDIRGDGIRLDISMSEAGSRITIPLYQKSTLHDPWLQELAQSVQHERPLEKAEALSWLKKRNIQLREIGDPLWKKANSFYVQSAPGNNFTP